MSNFWEGTKIIIRILGMICSLVLFCIGLWCGVSKEYTEGTYDLVLATSVWLFSVQDQRRTEEVVEVIDREAEARP